MGDVINSFSLPSKEEILRTRIRELEKGLREIHDWTCDKLIRNMAHKMLYGCLPSEALKEGELC